jgi:hypothetical protein
MMARTWSRSAAGGRAPRRSWQMLAGEIGRALDLPAPDVVLVDLDPSFARLSPVR